jgi:trans-aconitate methyltransferase
MNTNQKNACQDTWNNTRADEYIDSADIVVIERRRLIKILVDLYRYRFDNKKGLMLLDIGYGDGILSRYIQSKSPENIFYLLDGSCKMLEKAKQNIHGPNVFYIQKTFEVRV